MTGSHSKKIDTEMKQYLEDELVEAAQAQLKASRDAVLGDQERAIMTSTRSVLRSAAQRATPPRFKQEIADIAATVLKIPPERLDVKENMSRYGVDSIIVTEIMKCISDLVDLPIAPTLFFEARHLDELATILFQRYHKTLESRYHETSEQTVLQHVVPDAPRTSEQVEADIQSWVNTFKKVTAGKKMPQQTQSLRNESIEASLEDSARSEDIVSDSATSTRFLSTAESIQSPENVYEPVAIIAMEGTFAESATIEEFEKHLRQADDCLREVPRDRWDWKEVYGDPLNGEFTKVKYGGFAPDIDKFDPLFFGISHREAEVMDPQHRLFIQCVWRLIEAGGYAPRSLSGRKVGIFIGINLQDYAQLINQADSMEAMHLTSLGHMFCPNRLSFLLDVHGPSQVIDTACSSSLVALHRAVMSIQHEGCELAIAGGSNLLISPDMHVMYSKTGMICEDGRCKTFSPEANGYARGDGVGAVLLKSLRRAEQEGDNILAVIRGSAENHGGMSTSLTAPNPKAQASLIVETYQKANIDPRSIGYIECHGTGTALGDPIEINGLKMAFDTLYQAAGIEPPAEPYCGLGSVKSNIGHAETAAGIAGVIKTVLSLRHKQRYQTLHCEKINPLIELAESPFFILQKAQAWPRAIIEGHEQPRRAGVSSFGAGGSNAHVLIEEYSQEEKPQEQSTAGAVIMLSAKNEERLGVVVQELRTFLSALPVAACPSLSDIAYTLQVGRDALSHRLAIVVSSVTELERALHEFAQGVESGSGYYVGRVQRKKNTNRDTEKNRPSPEALKAMFIAGEWHQLASQWAQGVDIDWHQLYQASRQQGRSPRRIPLPTYPFLRQRYWLPESGTRCKTGTTDLTVGHLHPLAQQNTSDILAQRFSSVFTGDEFFLNDHVVMGKKVFPGVAYLEMARAAFEFLVPQERRTQTTYLLKNIVWARPFSVDAHPSSLHVEFLPEANGQFAYSIYSKADDLALTPVLHSQGTFVLPAFEQSEQTNAEVSDRLDLTVIKASLNDGQATEPPFISAKQCYDAFEEMGIAYGTGHQCLERIYFSSPRPNITSNASDSDYRPQVLAKLSLAANSRSVESGFVLHPGLMDASLQACIGLMVAAGHGLPTNHVETDSDKREGVKASLPFALDEMKVLSRLPETAWAWVRYAQGSLPNDTITKIDIDVCDEAGNVCVRLKGFSSRRVEAKTSVESDALLLCEPIWVSTDLQTKQAQTKQWAKHHVVLCDVERPFSPQIEGLIAAGMQEVTCSRISLSGLIENWFYDAATSVFEHIKEIFALKHAGPTLFQVIIPNHGSGVLLGGLSGLLKTACRENPKFFGQLIELDPAVDALDIVVSLSQNAKDPESAQIRYREASRQVLQWHEAKPEKSTSTLPWKDSGVYLLTGGLGGVGWLFARKIAEQAKNATVILCGRSTLTETSQNKIAQLRSLGLTILYRQVDVAREPEVQALIAEVSKNVGVIDGVLHCAGVLSDNFINKKTAQEFTKVFAPKISGVLNLDRATAQIDLSFFVMFSSAAGSWGSAGQADYATANAFLDSFSHYRNAQLRRSERQGRTIAINWPLWSEGGMRMEANALVMMRHKTGMAALTSDAGLRAFDQALASGNAQMMVLYGQVSRLRLGLEATAIKSAATQGGLSRDNSDVSLARLSGNELTSVSLQEISTTQKRDSAISKEDLAVAKESTSTQDSMSQQLRIDQRVLASKIQQLLSQFVEKLMKFAPEDIDVDADFGDYGFDSISFTDFSNKLNQTYKLELLPTVFFEFSTIAELAAWLSTEYEDVFARIFGMKSLPLPVPATAVSAATAFTRDSSRDDATESSHEDAAISVEQVQVNADQIASNQAIAIVGMSGCFPMAKDLEAFWDNLVQGKDCISEIPEDRWDWRAYYGDPALEANKSNIKWGGFIEGIADFDAKFFGISPKEAEAMDPQQRLLLTYAWRAIEDAGYSPASLSGSNTAVFIGTASSGYGDLLAKNGSAIESYSSTGVVGSLGPNRLSYFLNLHGPSEPIETACSSSLVAIHRAIASIANGDCDQAVVGGINLILSPETHISFNKAGMLSQDGRCKTFSSQADGYARGEGVGMLFIKKLADAVSAGDHIYAVIRSSVENHGGRANSLTAPNPKAQAELLKMAYRRAKVDPRSISYIEAHGTGTELGDPIEIMGLKTAFKELYEATGSPDITSAHCALGSVKTNIGHLELAAGIAGVIKVLLQLKHQTLVKTLHCEEVNPYIQLNNSPFYFVKDTKTWTPLLDTNGRALPRRAGVSSFGFGGVNAHIVLEEFVQNSAPTVKVKMEPKAPSSYSTKFRMIVLSAKNTDRLKAYAQSMLDFVACETSIKWPSELKTLGFCEQILQQNLCTRVAEILQIDEHEIEATRELDDYGFEVVHRSLLHAALEQSLELELETQAFMANHTLEAIAKHLLQENFRLVEKLTAQEGSAHVSLDRHAMSAEFSGLSVLARLQRARTVHLDDFAYTLQVGREQMECRLAFMADSLESVETKLRAFIEDRREAFSDLVQGDVKAKKRLQSTFKNGGELQEVLETCLEQGSFSTLLGLWVTGPAIDFESLYGESRPFGRRPNRLSLPGYPFLQSRFWLTTRSESQSVIQSKFPLLNACLHPLVHENISTIRQARFKTRLTGDEFFLKDHRVRGQMILPGVAYLEMARAAVDFASLDESDAQRTISLRDVVWLQPIAVIEPREIYIDLSPKAHDTLSFEIYSKDQLHRGASESKQTHSQGSVTMTSILRPMRLDLKAPISQSGVLKVDASACYERFTDFGFQYGPGHQAIRELYVLHDQVWAKLVLPASVRQAANPYILHPSLLDSALQASIGFSLLEGREPSTEQNAKQYLPFAIDSLVVFDSCVETMWAWVRRNNGSVQNERLQKLDIDLCDEHGEICVRILGFSSRLIQTSTPVSTTLASTPPAHEMNGVTLKTRTTDYLKELLASTLGYLPDDIVIDETLDAYGIDSMMVMKLNAELEKSFGSLSKTLFFEYQTLAEVANYFLNAHEDSLRELFKEDLSDISTTVSDARPTIFDASASRTQSADSISTQNLPGAMDIAIIGLSGRYPQSWDVEEYWRNLRDGKDCITDIPPERWDWHAYFNEDRTKPGGHYSKRGGFIADVDKFDPLFFNVSPSAAEYMDPQERLFLEHAWMAMEDAGYRRDDFRTASDDSLGIDPMLEQIGVYVGVMYGEYQMVALEAKLKGKERSIANFYAGIANRVSYSLNLTGPSMAVDTMCSSSLTAIHLACQDLKLGATKMAFAGGVNVSIHPNKYNVLSAGQYISSSGHCASFGEGGDGYVPSEGVGVVLLKRLADAERDGDHIYGVIKSSALNHGGKTNGYSVPNPKAQAAVIARALRDARVDPRAVTYIEAHGTGTKLGDPIEITGLTKAFSEYAELGQFCWIGSAKSNIGHTESAAGIASLTKVLLQMREGQIVPSLHSQTLNPNIDFSSTPFIVNQKLRDWPRPVIDGRAHCRAAGVSSYGAGGSNAHLIIEEYVQVEDECCVAQKQIPKGPCAIVLSARNKESLAEAAKRLFDFVTNNSHKKNQSLFLRNLAFTLQVGREAMPQRLAFMAEGLEELSIKLQGFLQNNTQMVYTGRAKFAREAISQPRSALLTLTPDNLELSVSDWVNGQAIDWLSLYTDQDTRPSRISLPTYPFARERYWTEVVGATSPMISKYQTVRADQSERVAENQASTVSSRALVLHPVWGQKDCDDVSKASDYSEHIIYFDGPVVEVPGAICCGFVSANQGIALIFSDYALALFSEIKQLLLRQPTGRVLLQIVTGHVLTSPLCSGQMFSALTAMLQTAQIENPRLQVQCIDLGGVTDPLDPASVRRLLLENARFVEDVAVRYRRSVRQVKTLEEVGPLAQLTGLAWKQGGVYLITGGAGGLGLIFAQEIIRHVKDAILFLTGRSTLSESRSLAIDALRAAGARVYYEQVDVCDAQAVNQLFAQIARECRKLQRGSLNAIIHSAGVIHDNFIIKKTKEEVKSVLAAKVAGAVNLDLASRGVDLDFMVFFSSLSAAVGNPGQADYATANAFMDSYAEYRNELTQCDTEMKAVPSGLDSSQLLMPRGHTLSINWPLWQDGGMDIASHSKEMMWRTAGLIPLKTEAGIQAFYTSLGARLAQTLVLQGDTERLKQLFLKNEPQLNDVAAPKMFETQEPLAMSHHSNSPGEEHLQPKMEVFITHMMADLLKIPSHRIEADVLIEQYGIDSVAIMKLINDLEKVFGSLPKTLFFEYPSIDLVSTYLINSFFQQSQALLSGSSKPKNTAASVTTRPIASVPSATLDSAPVQAPLSAPAAKSSSLLVATQPQSESMNKAEVSSERAQHSPSTVDSDAIAIIGMSGRFPQAVDIDAFWENLRQGRDAIIEIPKERWDYRQFFDADRNQEGTSYCKWGAFIEDVEKFDPHFFKLLPIQASLVDPQERLFLETVWNLLESSGYLGETLARLCESKVGVFAGSMSQQYHAFETDMLRESIVAMSSQSSIANRVSYYFNFKGPSISIDTMCSSSLVALHLACDSLRRGECKVAVAGGVNLSIHPKKYIGLSAGQMIGSDSQSTSFGSGDGYLPAEAVAAVLLKPLRAAIADQDEILAVIKSTSVNHSGQSNGYFVPSMSAQTDLLVTNFTKSGIDPRTVSYVEAAANGSSVADAIELNALNAAFQTFTKDRQFCAIGAVKSNIGHAEAASGMTQLIKVLLQLKHKQLVPTIKATPLNPNIKFEQTPFHLQRELAPWLKPVVCTANGVAQEYPRRATVSAFGAGGSNAHLILEEYEATQSQARRPETLSGPQLILLSARTKPQLAAVVQQLLQWLASQQSVSLDNLAFTLQTGREVMAFRLAVVVATIGELSALLENYLLDPLSVDATRLLFTGDSEQDNSEFKRLLAGATGQSMLKLVQAENDLEKLGLYWVRGIKITWHSLWLNRAVRKISLPTYPFDKKNYWLVDRPVFAGTASTTSASEAFSTFVLDEQSPLRENVKRYLVHSLAQLLVLPETEINLAKSTMDYGVDSVFSTIVRRGLEQVFQVKVSAREMLKQPSLDALADFVSEAALQDASFQKKLPTSEGQKGLWLLQQLTPAMSAYNVPLAFKIEAALDLMLFKQAFEYILRQHSALNTVFEQHGGDLCQIQRNGDDTWFEHLPIDSADEAVVIDVLKLKSKQAFDLKRGPLFRVCVHVNASSTVSYVLLTVHHIVFDGTSAVILLQDLMRVYHQLLEGKPPHLSQVSASYHDFVSWQQNFMLSQQAQVQLNYWKQQLSGNLVTRLLTGDYPRTATQRFEGASQTLTLQVDLANQVKVLARALKVNTSVIFLGALNILLQRYTGENDILIGMPTAGRPENRFERVVGYFINMVVVRGRISRQQDVASFFTDLQLTIADSLDHGDYPFASLLDALKLDRGHANSSLFQVVFAFQNFIQSEQFLINETTSEATSLSFLPGIHQEGSHDLALEVYQSDDTYLLRLDYNTDLFDIATIGQLFEHYLHILAFVCERPHAAISEHSLLSVDQRKRILLDWSADQPHDVSAPGLIEQFQNQAQLTPNQIAIICENDVLSYRELDQQSSQLAQYLQEQGVISGERIGVCLPRGVRAIIALLAVFKIAAVYVPMTPDFPEARLSHQLYDGNIKTVMTHTSLRDGLTVLQDKPDLLCICLDEVWHRVSTLASEKSFLVPADQVAYVIYTSGSTGTPKGVVIGHRSLGHHCQVMCEYYQLSSRDTVLGFASLAVDASIEQLLPALLCGATVSLRPDHIWSVQEFMDHVKQANVTVVDLPPAYFHEMLMTATRTQQWGLLRGLRLVIAGGEALSPDAISLWRDSPLRGARLVNAYGPTETTITSLVHEIHEQTSDQALALNIPIGRPLPGETVYIFDRYGQPVPAGVTGELHIGGAGLAIGYLNNPDLTQQKFIDNPVKPGSLVYKTGDSARWLKDGSVIFLGRQDQQVKIRGFRVECGEIEAVLAGLPQVHQAAVVVRGLFGLEQLVAFVVPEPVHQSLSDKELTSVLATVLPEYMIPTTFISIEQIPLTPGGKVDRAKLMTLDLSSTENRFNVEPRTQTEAQLTQIWRQVLNNERIGVFDNFFQLGGHSLLAIRLMSLIREQLGQDLPISSLFESPTIAAQAKRLTQRKSVWSPLVCLQHSGALSPWFFIHAVAGDALCYQALSEELGVERPFYALQAPSVESGLHPETIEGLATLYITSIQQVQPKGPYHLGGWSMGGVIAFEIARQLEKNGHRVATLSLIESYTPAVTLSFEAVSSNTLLEKKLSDSMFALNVRATDKYVPRHYSGHVQLFYGSDVSPHLEEFSGGLGGWQDFVTKDLVVRQVPGNHDTVLQRPFVHILAQYLSEHINQISH